ncbi:WxL domain-containing protein [Enterococcus faecalis]|uniref:WxL domain-containing protein n=1 Tax=Enterococcus faecalis TaxID=1351 RepID=UPI0013D0BE2D|nr:WxL domain-containing protein [Enterococcus faecalis]NGG35309.1 WxL domain-containing protein [Enterococcus faecalis]
MKKIRLFSMMLMGVAFLSVVNVSAEESKDFNSDSWVEFIKNTNKIKPTGSKKMIVPETDGSLNLSYVSRLNFGENIFSNKNEVHSASVQELKNVDGRSTDFSQLFAQVIDNRGSLEGWKLTAKQDTQLMTVNKQQALIGAKVSFKNTSMKTISKSKYPGIVNDLEFTPGESVIAVVASEGEGSGTWNYIFGQDISEDAGRKVSKDVTLEVPAGSVKQADEYRSTITWTLLKAP